MHKAAINHVRNCAHTSIKSRPQLTALTLALTAALGAMMPTAAQADPWTINGVSVAPGVQVSNTGAGILASGPALTTLNNSGTIIGTNGTVGTITNTANGVFNDTGSSINQILNNAGATIVGNDGGFGGTGILNSGGIATLDNAGLIQGGGTGITNNGSIVMLTNRSTAAVSGTVGQGVFNAGTITFVVNDGAISGGSLGLANPGSISSLTNSGIISGALAGAKNQGTIDSLNNAGGTIKSTASGLTADGILNTNASIGTLSNSGTILGSFANTIGIAAGVQNTSSGPVSKISVLTNQAGGTIGGRTGIHNQGNGSTIGTLSNSGLIGSGLEGIVNTVAGTITGLSNESSGIISGSQDGIVNSVGGTIGALGNLGLIGGGQNGVVNNGGTITALSNGSGGTISGSVNAILNDASGTLGAIANAGKIAGTITNLSGSDLTINGGTGSAFGTLTGFSGGVGTGDIGQIGNTASNLIFGSGNHLLNDNINVGSGHAVTNAAATLQVNNSINITGDYVQNGGATLNIGVNNAATANGSIVDTGYGRLLVSGNATIDAGSTVALKKVDSYGFAQGQRFLVVQAGGAGTNYHADSLNYAAVDGFNGTVSGQSVADGGNTDLLLTLVAPPTPPTGTPPSAPDRPINRATDANSAAALAGLFNYNGTDPALMNLFNAAAALGSADAGNRAGAQLSPTANAVAANQAAQAPTQQVLNVTTARLDNLRLSQADGGSGIATGERAADPAVWAQAFGGSASQGQRDGVSGYHTGYSGLLIGSDVMIGEGWRVGGLFNYADTSVRDDDANAGSSAHIDSYGLMAYAGYQGRPWYLNVSGGAVRQKYDTTRAIAFDGFAGNAGGSYNGMQYIAAAQAGYPIDLGGALAGAKLTLTPIAGLTYSALRQDGYTESGGNGAALAVDAANSHSLKSDFGAKLERTFKTAYGNLAPSAQLTWRHEYQDTRLQSVASFAADTSGATSFISQGPTPVADTGVLSIGVTLMRSENLSIAAKYVIESGGGYTSQTGDLLVRWRF